MRFFLLLISAYLPSCQSSILQGATISPDGKNGDTASRKIITTLKLSKTLSSTPGCGTFAFAVAQKFDVVSSSQSLGSKQIVVIIPCPELYGEGYFVKGKLYQSVLTAQNTNSISYSVISRYKESKLPTFWAEKIKAPD